MKLGIHIVKVHVMTFHNNWFLYGFTAFVGQSLPAKCCELEINMNTPLVMLLPSWRGQGLCSMAMVYFLCAVQNHFLDGYAEIMNIQ